MIFARNRQACDCILDALSRPATGCLGELQNAHKFLVDIGFQYIPSWTDLVNGVRPPLVKNFGITEPGEWQHGWQYHASSQSDFHVRRTLVLPRCGAAACAHVRAHSGPNAGCALSASPMTKDVTIPPLLFRTLLLVGTLEATVGHHRCPLRRLWCSLGLSWATSGFLSTVRASQGPRWRSGACRRACMQGGRRQRTLQRSSHGFQCCGRRFRCSERALKMSLGNSKRFSIHQQRATSPACTISTRATPGPAASITYAIQWKAKPRPAQAHPEHQAPAKTGAPKSLRRNGLRRPTRVATNVFPKQAPLGGPHALGPAKEHG